MGFTLIDHDNVLDNVDLNIQELGLLIALISYYNKQKGYAYPSYEQLMKRSRIKSKTTFINTLNSLLNKEYIKRETIKGKGCRYFIKDLLLGTDIDQVQNCTKYENVPTPSTDIDQHQVQKCTTTNTNTNTNINTNINSHSQNDKTEDKYLEIFNHWNKEHKERGIAKAVKLNADIKKGIDNALKLKKEDDTKINIADIKESISNYAEVYNLELFTYQWRLVDFLKRKQRDTGIQQLLLFLNNGTTYVNCKARLNKSNYNNAIDDF
ncbi:hypothetical protein UT300018_10420 [Clostridium faecium]